MSKNTPGCLKIFMIIFGIFVLLLLGWMLFGVLGLLYQVIVQGINGD